VDTQEVWATFPVLEYDDEREDDGIN
jgi:hypothetical protein